MEPLQGQERRRRPSSQRRLGRRCDVRLSSSLTRETTWGVRELEGGFNVYKGGGSFYTRIDDDLSIREFWFISVSVTYMQFFY